MGNATQKHSIGKTIAKLRKAKGWTQVDLAEKLQVSDKAVSKWEKDDSMPSIEFFPILANLFGVTIDYLMTGKKEEPAFSLDDLDKTKRALYLIEKDDVENFVKYGYVNPVILLSATNIDRNFTSNKENEKYRKAIIDNQSFKIFSVLADALLEKLKHNDYNYLYSQYCASAAGLVFDYLDDFVKLCALSNKVELLSFVKFKSFDIRTGKQDQFCRANDMYHISQDTLDYIFMDTRVPQNVIDFVAKYEKYSQDHYRYSYGPTIEIDSSNAIRMANNILLSLYKTKRFDAIECFIGSLKEEAQTSFSSVNCDDHCWRSSYSFGNYGYMFYHNGNGSMETTTCCGKMVVINDALSYSIKQKDKKMALKFNEYNLFVKGLLDKLPDFNNKPTILIADEKAIDKAIEDAKQQEIYDLIMADKTLTEYERRRRLFAIGKLSIVNAIEADDYELFAQFEDKSNISITFVAENCKDIRFFIFAVGIGQSQEKLDEALNTILTNDPERYDIIEVLLSAGATIKDNPAMTAIIKQNIEILNRQKEGTIVADIEVNTEETKQHLISELENGRTEYVVVNLAIQLEKKLKAKYGNGIQLLDMIDKAFNDGLISDTENAMLHHLRKARNTLLHEGTEKAFFTPELVKEWIEIVYKF